MTELEFKFKTELEFSAPVTEHVFALHCLPIEDEAQAVQAYGVAVEPEANCEMRRDGFGSWLVCGSCCAPHDKFAYASHGIVRVDLARRQKQEPNPVLRCHTALTRPEGSIPELWQSLPLEDKTPLEQAQILNMAAADALKYTAGVTNNATTAAEALALRQGVCQDYAHLLIALARLSGFAARYCMGLIPGEGATHAWAELCLPEGWRGFDPTHGCEAGEKHLRFAAGRDAADCRAEKGVFKGIAQQAMRVDMVLSERTI